MTPQILTFSCSICAEPSRDICVACTKDACKNHRCERCKRCSDCCGCDVPLSAAEVGVFSDSHAPFIAEPVPAPEAILTPEPAMIPEPTPELEPEVAPPDTREWHDALPELFRPDPEPKPE